MGWLRSLRLTIQALRSEARGEGFYSVLREGRPVGIRPSEESAQELADAMNLAAGIKLTDVLSNAAPCVVQHNRDFR